MQILFHCTLIAVTASYWRSDAPLHNSYNASWLMASHHMQITHSAATWIKKLIHCQFQVWKTYVFYLLKIQIILIFWHFQNWINSGFTVPKRTGIKDFSHEISITFLGNTPDSRQEGEDPLPHSSPHTAFGRAHENSAFTAMSPHCFTKIGS